MKCGAWKTGRSYAERSCAHGAQLLCLVSRGRSPGTITERYATLRRERLTEEPPKGETGHLPGDTRQQSESFTRSSKSSLLEIAFRISLYRTSIWCVVCRSVHHFDVCNYAYVHHFDVYPLTTHTEIILMCIITFESVPNWHHLGLACCFALSTLPHATTRSNSNQKG